MIYVINGEEVEHISIDKSNDKINVKYSEKFDIVTAHISRIQKKLRDQNLNVTICKDIYNGYIGIFLEEIEDYIGITHILEVPMRACQLDRENNFLIIRINQLSKYQNTSFMKIIDKIEN